MIPRDNMAVNEGVPFPNFDGSSLASIKAYLESIRDKAFLVGGLALQAIPSMHRIVAELVWVNVEEPGAIYPTGKDDSSNPKPVWSLGNKTLKRLARAADLSWDAHQSRRIDDGRDPDLRTYRRVCRVRELDGSMRVITEEYTLDLRVREQELVEAKKGRWFWERGEGQLKETNRRIDANAAEAKAGKVKLWSDEFIARLRSEKTIYPESDRDSWAAEQARLEMITVRKFADQRAVTGAESRCIIAALALSRGGYLLDDLATKPFAVLKLVPDIDYKNDPMARTMLVAMHSGLVDAAFGHGKDLGALFAAPQPAPMMIPAPRYEDDPGDPDADMAYEAPEDENPIEVPSETVEAVEVAEAPAEVATIADEVAASEPELIPIEQLPSPDLPASTVFAAWNRSTRIKLLQDLQGRMPNLPRIDLAAAEDAGLLRYYELCLRFVKADAERRSSHA